ncbi:hypothetical protein OF83DRAFT_693556 [Amylostereum chailletii]|nr:hypothetical protein OF83DRAFT_693556 [Amylostereum chailletii]
MNAKSDPKSNSATQPPRKASAGASSAPQSKLNGSAVVNSQQTANVPAASVAPPIVESDLGLKSNGMITIPADLNAPSPPITPKPTTSAFASSSPSHFPPQPQPQLETQTEESPTTPTNDSRPPSVFTLPPSTPSRNSLTSSRPAPPSPAQSRRTSAALIRSRPSSATLQSSSSRRASRVPQEKENVPATAPPKRKSILIKIRDFAFAASDPRHTSTGPDTPRPTRRLQRPISTWSQSSVGSSANGEDDEDAGHGWGLSWGLGRLSWFNRGSVSGPNAGATDSDDGGPSATDFARNFDPDNEADNPYDSWGAHNDADELSDEGEGDGEGEAGELPPGMYRALYAFEPEGTAEMALEEDQVVHVIGRGGGVGWAVALRENGEHALVPEGYLELINADEGPDAGVGEEVR